MLRRNINTDSIYYNTLIKPMDLLTRHVERKISCTLPDQSFQVFNGWSNRDTLYIGIFASFYQTGNIYESHCYSVWLAISPSIDEKTVSATSNVQTIEHVLPVFDKSLENVVSLIGDNVSTNIALQTQAGKRLIGCDSHIFNLYMQDVIEKSLYVVQNVQKLTVKLR